MFFFERRRDDILYQSLEEKNEENGSVYKPDLTRSRIVCCDFQVNFWTFLAAIFAITTIVLAVLLERKHVLVGGTSFQQGFATDLAAARSAVEKVEYKFTGELGVNEYGEWFRNVDHNSPQYVGPPNDTIDDAWIELLKPINLDLTGEENLGIQDTYVWPGTDRHYTGLTVHHTLHCVNLLRLAIYRDYYRFPDDPAKVEFTWIHLDHCIDFVRQAVQCQADLTPMKWYWSDDQDQLVLKPESLHTCRRWESIQEWALERAHIRSEEELAKVPKPPPHGTWTSQSGRTQCL